MVFAGAWQWYIPTAGSFNRPRRKNRPALPWHLKTASVQSQPRPERPPVTPVPVLRIPVIVGSVRRGRQSIKVARFAGDRLQEAGAEAPLLDLARIGLPIMEERLYMRDDPPPGLVPFSEAVASADAVVVVSPEYNGSIPGVLKNALDYLYSEWNRKPVGIITVSAAAPAAFRCTTTSNSSFCV